MRRFVLEIAELAAYGVMAICAILAFLSVWIGAYQSNGIVFMSGVVWVIVGLLTTYGIFAISEGLHLLRQILRKLDSLNPSSTDWK